MILGVDTGGTFTDFVLFTEQSGKLPNQGTTFITHKVLSTPDSPERAILQGIEEMGLSRDVREGKVKIIHGSTVATNAALEGKGVSTAFITNTGFRDLLTIGRQTRPRLYHLETPPLTPPVPRQYCLEVPGRIDANGDELESLDMQDLHEVAETLNTLQPDAVAISLLFSFLDHRHELAIAQFLEQNLDYAPFITCSSEVLPEYREYERGIATWLNATLGPLVSNYLLSLKASTSPSRLSVMQSSGGTIAADQAARKSVNLLLSGPAGGLAAAHFLGSVTGQSRLMTFDMGGTSTDVALLDGRIGITNEGSIGAYPVAVPMVDMHTIGAGGGSIASIDAGGLLQVGPQSAGASPGPACYGKGGTLPTVTDANLVLGRLQPDAFLGGNMQLDPDAARTAIAPLAQALALGIEETALGIVQLANEHMARALRVISVARGFDPKAFRLCCFGGAGGLHICALAEAMDMNEAMVPVNAGVLSAMGMLLAPVERQLSQTYQALLPDLAQAELESVYSGLERQGLGQLEEEGVPGTLSEIQRSMDLRYAGQSASLNIAWASIEEVAEAFHSAHEQRYGHRLATPIELVNIRVSVRETLTPPTLAKASESAPGGNEAGSKALYGINTPVPVINRADLRVGSPVVGPALILENNATTWLSPGWEVDCDAFGNLILQKAARTH